MVQDSINALVTISILDGDETINLNQLVSQLDAIYATTKDLDLGDPTKEKYIDTIVFDIDAIEEVAGLQVEVGYRDRLQDDTTWLAAQPLTLDDPIASCRVTARFFTLKFSDTMPEHQWAIRRIEFYGKVLGKGRITP